MLKILIKALILVCIILSIYFIVNPSACSNLVNGRVVNSLDAISTPAPDNQPQRELLTPVGDQGQTPQKTNAQEQSVPAVMDTNSTQPAPSAYNQDEVDYAIASRYVELEKEYTLKHPDTKDTAKEISYIVMDDFELTPSEWEAFLQRATASNLFEKVRQAQH